MPTPQEIADAEAAAVQAAQPADPDTEMNLVSLQRMMAHRRPDPIDERHYEVLRNALVDQLKQEGPRLFVDDHGHKTVAVAIVPESINVDLDQLLALAERDGWTQAEIDEIAPRKVDPEVVRRFFHRKKISNGAFASMATIVPKTGHVKFLSAQDADE